MNTRSGTHYSLQQEYEHPKISSEDGKGITLLAQDRFSNQGTAELSTYTNTKNARIGHTGVQQDRIPFHHHQRKNSWRGEEDHSPAGAVGLGVSGSGGRHHELKTNNRARGGVRERECDAFRRAVFFIQKGPWLYRKSQYRKSRYEIFYITRPSDPPKIPHAGGQQLLPKSTPTNTTRRHTFPPKLQPDT
jgi:hypothetical protein